MNEQMQHLLTALAAIISVAVGYWKMHIKMNNLAKTITEQKTRFAVEHEILIDFYCDKTGIDRSDLPTRHNGVLK